MIEYIFISILGLSFGSFLNVLIYRLPLNKSIIKPPSYCPKCKSYIKTYHNIPIISYILLKRKCHICKTKISLVYPLVEIITMLITLLTFMKVGISIEFINLLIIFYLLIVLSFIDLKFKAVPDYLLVIVFFSTLFITKNTFLISLKNGLLFAGGFIILDFLLTFYIQNIKYKLTKNQDLKDQKALGEGDIPIVFIIGFMLGIQDGLNAIFLSAVLAILPSLYNMIFKKDIETAFIPYLSLGFFIIFISQNTKYIY